MEAFPCLRIARQCAAAGGTACAMMNGANEAAVAAVFAGRDRVQRHPAAGGEGTVQGAGDISAEPWRIYWRQTGWPVRPCCKAHSAIKELWDMVYILAAILVFGVLIAVHELGHFMAAKACGVRVNEFSIGMGPTLWKKQKGETQYSLRLFPVGGFCAMEGEEEDSDDPTALNNQGFWAKLLIFAAGAAMNFIAGLLIILVLYADAQAFYVPVVAGFADGCPLESADGLQEGDRLAAH